VRVLGAEPPLYAKALPNPARRALRHQLRDFEGVEGARSCRCCAATFWWRRQTTGADTMEHARVDDDAGR
jgi:hypothetical protein